MIQKLIVLGGGSAGFMAAIALKHKVPPNVRVLLIRSPDIGIIGVGEGSTPSLTSYLHSFLKVPPRQLFEIAQPTWKLGLKFLWGPLPHFYYSFYGPSIEGRLEPTQIKPNGYYCPDDIDDVDPIMARMGVDRVFEQSDGWPMFATGHYAYHLENEKFVHYLEAVAASKEVEVLDATVAHVHQDEQGVARLSLQSGREESADLYIDCSGFRSLLLGKTLQEPFVSYRSSLFCERAIIGGWDRQAPEEQVIKPYTTCETMDAGWAWQIEHEHRINRGYVYCPDFITDEQAEREFRAKNPWLGPTRVVRFVSGRYERAWVKNVVAVGNASGFVEPLEATALGAIAQQSRALSETLWRSEMQPRPSQIMLYNRMHAQYWDPIRNFLAIHYKYNTRLDTPFWRECREKTDLADGARIVEYYRENGPEAYWGPGLIDNPHDQFGATGYFQLLAGMKVPCRQTYRPGPQELDRFNQLRLANREAALRCMTVRDVLAAVSSPRANII
ncbi:MAG TPA: tryptophan halogenase family protein [Tepidisphaeraceae bacterium]|jgi:tryptophan halogenase